jgi:hypothetical protein
MAAAGHDGSELIIGDSSLETPITGRNCGLKKGNWAQFFATVDPVLTQAQISL